MRALVPSMPRALSAAQVAQTAATIAGTQERSGAIPWFRGGHVDPWDHIECAMALVVAGKVTAAERAYGWLFTTQREDGSWPMRSTSGVVDDDGTDANMCAYVAVGVWHHWLVRRDRGFVRRAWPSVRRALDHVTSLQLPFGGIAWAQDATGRVTDEALVAGSSSILHALCCGIALGELVDEPQWEWELAAGRVGHALRAHEDGFEPKDRYSMDWYYPVLAGPLRGEAARRRLLARWEEFVVPGLGIRCVDDHPWVTGAETCELALALDAVGEHEQARVLLGDMQHLRDRDGSYWTGYVYSDDARWPEETSTWTAASVILAVDALSRTSPGSGIFRDTRPPDSLTLAGLECGCPTSEASHERLTGLAADPGQHPHGPKGPFRDEVPALDRA